MALDMDIRPVFAYGTLMFDAVLVALLQRLPESRPARLIGYRRFAIRDRVYPAIVPDADSSVGSSVRGLVLLGLTADERTVLDEFEDEDYIKTPLTVHVDTGVSDTAGTGAGTGEGGVKTTAETVADVYVWRAEFADELEGDWDAAAFGQVRDCHQGGDDGGGGGGGGNGDDGTVHDAQGGGSGVSGELTRYVAMCRQWVEADYDWGQVE